MDALTRQEYPAMLDSLPPSVAVAKFIDRVKKITRVNIEIANWLQERRRIEETYASSLRKLSKRQLNDVWGHMGVFELPWKQMMTATEDIAKSHNYFAKCIERDVESPLRYFAATNDEMSNVTTMRTNISSLAKELEDAQLKREKLSRKGGKANASRLDTASSRLQAAKQQWDVQAAFVFESLQALDERRVNHLRDILTQYQTHEADHIQLNREAIESTLKNILDISTEAEIRNWSQTDGIRKTNFIKYAQPGANNSFTSAQTSSSHADNQSDLSQPVKPESSEIKKLQRVGTLLTRRRKSVQSVFRSVSPASKKNGFQLFGRDSKSQNSISQSPPRASSSNAVESNSRLFSLPESPTIQSPVNSKDVNKLVMTSNVDLPPRKSSLSPANGTSSTGPSNEVETETQSELPENSTTKNSEIDDEGFTVPKATNDPISQALDESLQTNQPHFKLNIQKDPILEHDSDAEAAVSNVTNTLRSSHITNPVRKTGTFRGRRDVRNNISLQTLDSLGATLENNMSTTSIPISPIATTGKAPGSSRISSTEQTTLIGPDSASIISTKSWKTQMPDRHPEMYSPGINCSIIETVSTSFEKENPASTTISGEIVLLYNPDSNIEGSDVPKNESIKLHNITNLDILVPNKLFIQPISMESQDQYTVNLSLISSKSIVAFTYRIQNSETSKIIVPLLIRSAWKTQADKLGLVVEYKLNPLFSSSPVCFINLILIAHYSNVSASTCQTKPSGTHVKDKLLVYWRLGDVVLDGTWLKAIARFSGTEDLNPQPGYIETKWEIDATENSFLSSDSSGISGGLEVKRFSNLKHKVNTASTQSEINNYDADPFADDSAKVDLDKIPPSVDGSIDDNWKPISTMKKLVSGKYLCK